MNTKEVSVSKRHERRVSRLAEDFVIEMLHITKEFPGIKANDDITLQLRKGEVHALLGENGAGKSTLMSVLFGLYQPEAGQIRKNGKEVAELTGLGLTTIHKFENGTAGNLSLSTFLLLLKVVGQIDAINDVLPELPPSPYLMRKDEKKAQRIRHTKR